MKLSQITAIGRPVDPRYPTNRAIALIAVSVIVIAAITQIWSGKGWLESAVGGIPYGIAVFVSWALGRELDPDHDLAAFGAAALMGLGLVVWHDLPNLGLVFWLLLIIRVVNRTTGLAVTMIDSLGVIAFGVLLAGQGNWGLGIITALALLLDSQLTPRNPRQLWFAGVALVGTLVVAGLAGVITFPTQLSLSDGSIALGLSALFLPIIGRSKRVVSVGDEDGVRLNALRVQGGQALALLIGLEVALASGLLELLPLWAAVIGIAGYGLIVRDRA